MYKKNWYKIYSKSMQTMKQIHAELQPSQKPQKPKARSSQPEAKSKKKLEAESQKPNARSEKPEAKCQKWEARSQSQPKFKCKKDMQINIPLQIYVWWWLHSGTNLVSFQKKKQHNCSEIAIIYRKHDDRPMAFWGVPLCNFQPNQIIPVGNCSHYSQNSGFPSLQSAVISFLAGL